MQVLYTSRNVDAKQGNCSQLVQHVGRTQDYVVVVFTVALYTTSQAVS